MQLHQYRYRAVDIQCRDVFCDTKFKCTPGSLGSDVQGIIHCARQYSCLTGDGAYTTYLYGCQIRSTFVSIAVIHTLSQAICARHMRVGFG